MQIRFLPFHVKFLSIFFFRKSQQFSILIKFHNYIQVIFEKIKLKRNLLYCPQKFFKILYNKVVFPLKNMHIFVLFAKRNLLYCPQKFFKILYIKVVFPLKNMHIFVLFAKKKEQRQNKKRFE